MVHLQRNNTLGLKYKEEILKRKYSRILKPTEIG